ncbi:cell division ATP-binding protein FtsE [Liquorilactobacillus nagelii]|uniref:Cell division protein FtsE n=1 Tax=Liquorilactobacillus nagelii TaxID=82688 RepID=A0A0A7RLI9_9LACO|nr:ATP-binding cassette domain-containing protein [Liquorilactobacillus nagelii]AJA34143.1 cell division protein FtsE [Liquorilactobacillus nagelii]KRL42087.1 cell division ATP-binding protein FtsE [Liquorilactobacillus nagelii DSM 13675]QYH55061.1 ATP-binding cassette domain-containing protein [Liquorilactobacillus nagelii DSM 13675]
MIKLEHVSKLYDGKVQALEDISLQINQGEFVYIVGPSGAGKTTLLKLMDKQENLTSGSLQMGSMLVERIRPSQTYILRRQIGIVLQQDLFIPYLNVDENIIYSLAASGVSDLQQQREKMQAVLTTVGMSAYQNRRPAELSVGQRKKVAIARALINQPSVVLADEPTANLDARSAIEIMKLFFKFNLNGTTVIIATHDSTIVNSLRHRVIELQKGKIIRDENNGKYSTRSDPKDIYVW